MKRSAAIGATLIERGCCQVDATQQLMRSLSSTSNSMIRLSKRMSELDMCSRREADRFISKQEVLVRGVPAILGQKVLAGETDIELLPSTEHHHEAVVLHKPTDYVSSQPEDGHVPAVRLLTPSNLLEGEMGFAKQLYYGSNETLTGYAPAGRLDMDSSGLLVFCNSGVLAKKLVSSEGLVEKEYIVQVEAARHVSKEERQEGLQRLPKPTLNLSMLQLGGCHLWKDPRPLRPITMKWINKGETLKITLKEGRKRQIRRMCRELLGFHVVELQRTRIGPIHLSGLPVGKWRPLEREEINTIMALK